METYHLLCADPDNNLPRALASAVKAAEHSATRAQQWAELVSDAGRDTDHPALRQWGLRLREGVRDSDLTQYLTYLIDDARLDESVLSIALEERGDSHRMRGRYEDALADFNRAIELNSSSARAIGGRGLVYFTLSRYTEALADVNRAIELSPSDAWTIIGRGATYREMGCHQEALADLNRAIELDPSYSARKI